MKSFFTNHVITNKKQFCTFYLVVLALVMPFRQYGQQTYTFTNCGATGSVGPTQTMVANAYSLTNLNGSVTVIGSGIQQWTVPVSGLYGITAYGASGGRATGSINLPGNGAIISGNFNLTAGTVVRILVGQMGQDRQYSAGGGGGTYVTVAPHNTLSSILVVAGGGGASSADFPGLSAVTATCGTFDVQSGPAQCSGDGGISFTGNSGGGGGGFFTSGQAGGIGQGGMSYTLGGLGGGTDNQQAGGFGGGGGQNGTGTYAASGGGGFSGGNGGNRNSTSGTGRMGGGGGGSYNNGTNQLNSVNTSTGHGRVIIQELCSITLNSSTSGSLAPLICSGTTLTLTTNAVSNYSWSNGSTASSIVITPTTTTVYSLTATSPSNCIATRVVTVTVSSGIPTLSINTGTNSICAGQSLNFIASGANTYTWSNGIVNGSAYTPTSTASYTVIGQNGCGTSSAVTTITIAPLPVSLISNPTVVCAGSTSTLTAATAANSYTWFPVTTNASSLIVSPISNSIYTVVVSNGTCLGSATVAVNANPVPTIIASPTLASICSGDQLVLSASGAGSYTWTPGNLSGNSVTVSPTVPTPYQVVGTNSFGCTGAANLAIIVNPSPTLNLVANTNFICAGDVVTITVNGANSYTWDSGANTTTITANPLVSTTYSVTGLLNGCYGDTSIQISVFIPTLSITGNTSICLGETATITASGANTYNWSNGFNTAAIQVVPTSNTIYTVSALTNSGSINCPSSGSVQVQVKALPSITIASTKNEICKGESATLTASGANTYTWSNGSNGTSITPSSSLVSTFVYSVTGTSTLNCVNTATAQLKINACTGIDEKQFSNQSINVYPNPNNGSFYITANTNLQVSITNELGQVIKEIELNADNNYQENLQNLTSGIYFVICIHDSQKTIQKIIVTK